MFTALVLVCAATVTQPTPTECFTYQSNMMFATEEECVADLYQSYLNGAFLTLDPVNKKVYDLVDFRCVNWNEPKV